MAMQVKEIRQWLSYLGDEELVGVDDGGLSLTVNGSDGNEYLEIGGVSDNDPMGENEI